MIKQQLDLVIDRKNSNSMKWHVKEGELPMWVADMDFRCCDAIIETLKNRVEHGIFGYSDSDEEWAESICDWWSDRHHWITQKDWLLFSSDMILKQRVPGGVRLTPG